MVDMQFTVDGRYLTTDNLNEVRLKLIKYVRLVQLKLIFQIFNLPGEDCRSILTLVDRGRPPGDNPNRKGGSRKFKKCFEWKNTFTMLKITLQKPVLRGNCLR